MTTVEIGNAGEQHVEHFLQSKNYQTVIRDTKQAGSTDITANGIRVQVKTAVVPEEPSEVTEAEKTAIKNKAAVTHAEAWLAYVQIKNNKELNKPIRWVKVV